MTGHAPGCTDEPGCDTTRDAVSPVVLAALEDAATRLTGSLSDATASAVVSRLDQLSLALAQRDMLSGRLALAAAYDALGYASRTTPDARADIDAIRLALLPAARALGVSTYAASSATP